MVMKVESYKKKTRPRFREGIVRVGFFADVKYDDKDGKTVSVAQVARWNEFGTKVEHGIPERPFMRPAVFANKAQLTEKLRSLYKQALKDKKPGIQALETFGEYVVELIKKQIDATYTPENSPITIHGGWLGYKGGRSVYVEGKQGKSHPLKDTGFMQDSVSYKAEEVFK